MLTTRRIELCLEVANRRREVVAAQGCCLGKSRVGEVVGVAHAGALLFGGDLAIQIADHLLEVPHHLLDVARLARALGDFKSLQA